MSLKVRDTKSVLVLIVCKHKTLLLLNSNIGLVQVLCKSVLSTRVEKKMN